MAKALQNGIVDQYIFEVERLKPFPLDKVEHAIIFKKLSGYTRESASRSSSESIILLKAMSFIRS
jgi:hypothetical protein